MINLKLKVITKIIRLLTLISYKLYLLKNKVDNIKCNLINYSINNF